MAALSHEEARNVVLALRVLRARLGTQKELARSLGLSQQWLVSLMRGYVSPSVGVALRVARLADVPMDDVLAGRFPACGTCPNCGHRLPTFTDETTIAEPFTPEEEDA
jgi:DNA-binding XRE family transcriptional regulator